MIRTLICSHYVTDCSSDATRFFYVYSGVCVKLSLFIKYIDYRYMLYKNILLILLKGPPTLPVYSRHNESTNKTLSLTILLAFEMQFSL